VIFTTYTRPLSVQAQYSRSCPIISSSCYNSSLVTWTVVCLIAAKFRPPIFPVAVFALPDVANICIFMILCDFITGEVVQAVLLRAHRQLMFSSVHSSKCSSGLTVLNVFAAGLAEWRVARTPTPRAGLRAYGKEEASLKKSILVYLTLAVGSWGLPGGIIPPPPAAHPHTHHKVAVLPSGTDFVRKVCLWRPLCCQTVWISSVLKLACRLICMTSG
jgi:hypothetical protein